MNSKENKNEARAVASGSQRSSLEQAFPKNPTTEVGGVVKAREVKKPVELEIYTDGGCSVHLGKLGGWAFIVVENDEIIHEEWGSLKNTTNSVMEIMALMNGLKYALKTNKKVVIKSDSQYCVNSYNDWAYGWVNRGWRKSNNKPVEHPELWKQIHELRSEKVTVEWVRGHSGNKYNEYVDSLTHNRHHAD